MSNYAIRVEGLGKRYRIGERQQYKALRDVLTDALTAPARAAGRLLGGQPQGPRPDSTIWALKDVSFEVEHGEVLGIIGRNGAGKSTLLKILSRITEPTEGEVRLRGRVGSLLEVGTGFHPELTGRENIYLNGAVLGMSRAEIERKFDEIVAFAEVERFIDTPVKHYSSGMAVRLGFAVAAHLEPEILLVDEVLAVGDASFQRKCLSKIEEIAKGGQTALFVSHNLDSVDLLCRQAIWLDKGSVRMTGRSRTTIDAYLRSEGPSRDAKSVMATQSRSFDVANLAITGQDGELPKPLRRMEVRLTVRPRIHTADLAVHLLVCDSRDNLVFGLDSRDFEMFRTDGGLDQVDYTFRISSLPLAPGEYLLKIYIKSYSRSVYEWADDTFRFKVEASRIYGLTTLLPAWHGQIVVDASVEVS